MYPIEVAMPGVPSPAAGTASSVWVRPVRGDDEAFVAEHCGATPAACANALLTRCLSAGEPRRPLSVSFVRELTVGQRDTLLLHLRRVSAGERITCVVACPGCAENLDIDLRISELLAVGGASAAQEHEAAFEVDGEVHVVRFRVPTAGELEEAARLALTDTSAAVQWLMRRCVTGDVPPGAVEEVGRRMSAADPGAEILLDAVCPACGQRFSTPFDITQFLVAELSASRDSLMREVHVIASHYHWSERDILRLPRPARRRYLEFILNEPSATGSGGRG